MDVRGRVEKAPSARLRGIFRVLYCIKKKSDNERIGASSLRLFSAAVCEFSTCAELVKGMHNTCSEIHFHQAF